MLRQLGAVLALVSAVLAQDTHYCNDGWELFTTTWDGTEHHSCFWFGQYEERVTHDVATLICQGMGGFLAEVPWGPHLNYWIVGKLLERTKNLDTKKPNFDVQYWLGAKDFDHHHSEHNPGTWVWEHRNTTVEWFDWAEGEPNNLHGENCLTYLLYEDIFGFRMFHWNDSPCDRPMDFICEKYVD